MIKKNCNKETFFFGKEIYLIKEKFKYVDYPLRFRNSVTNEFQNDKHYRNECFMILPDLFEITKLFMTTEIAYYKLY